MKLQVRVEQAIAAAEKKGRELPGQPEHGQGERSCDNCGNPKCGPALICKSSTREHWQPIPAKVDNMCNDDCAACKTEPCPITVSRIDDNNLAKLLADCAECLDDCLVRMYPDEFDRDTVTDADKRFFEHNGGIARVTDLFERIKRYVPAKVDVKNVCVWTWDTDGFWHTGCNKTFCTTDGGNLSAHKIKYCPYCGRNIK